MNTGKSTTNLAQNKESGTPRLTQADISRFPNPDNFDLYLPWAYNQLEGETGLVVHKTTQHEYVNIGRSSDRSKGKGKRSRVMPSPVEDEKSASWQPILMTTDREVKIITTYDQSDNLVHIKFDKNVRIPVKLMKIISLIIRFQDHLTGVTINKGLDMYTVHELKKWLPLSGITDICLDDTFVKEGNYDILLEKQSVLKNLSLARCKINDNVVKNIASMLMFPNPASKTLSLLNLASNRITEVGAKYLAEALRSNRRLYYLNLADNMVSDEGVSYILDVLIEFPLKTDEIMAMRSKHINYLKQKNQLSDRILKDLKAGEYDKRVARRKSVKAIQSTAKKLKGLERDASAKKLVEGTTNSMVNMEAGLRDKADAMAENMLGGFHGPFTTAHTKIVDGITYCLGNNVLCYLNLAYNNICYVSVKKLLNVVFSQKIMNRKPHGLVNVCIEGNNIPIHCPELANIDEILESGLRGYTSKMSVNQSKKKAASKPSSLK